MQTVPFPAHYQSVYTNSDFSSFSLISCTAKEPLLVGKTAAFATPKRSYHFLMKLSLQSQGYFIIFIKQEKEKLVFL